MDRTVVLVAEDSTTVRNLIRRILERAGFEVIEAADGIEAVTLCALEHPAVAVLDIEMPGCDGMEALRRIKANEATAGTQVLMLTAADQAGSVSAALDLGAIDYVRKPCSPVELTARVRNAAKLANQSEALRRSSNTDELTGLLNRRGMTTVIDTLAGPAWPLVAVAVVDADHFKRVNDEHGHDAGDEVLRVLAARLQGAWPLVQMARWGGEEFLAAFPARSVKEAAEVCERLRAAAAGAPISLGPGRPSLTVTVSVGFAVVERGESPSEAVSLADAALYDAKRSGRDRVIGPAGLVPLG